MIVAAVVIWGPLAIELRRPEGRGAKCSPGRNPDGAVGLGYWDGHAWTMQAPNRTELSCLPAPSAVVGRRRSQPESASPHRERRRGQDRDRGHRETLQAARGVGRRTITALLCASPSDLPGFLRRSSARPQTSGRSARHGRVTADRPGIEITDLSPQ